MCVGVQPRGRTEQSFLMSSCSPEARPECFVPISEVPDQTFGLSAETYVWSLGDMLITVRETGHLSCSSLIVGSLESTLVLHRNNL